MTRFADPARCPDCQALLMPGSFVCPSCHLDLSGELGRRLFTLLTDADQVLDRMRARSAVTVAQEPRREPVAGPPPPMPPVGRPRPVVSGTTVPQVLLGLGALTLLVAISLFFAVTWGALGASGRALLLLLLTGASGAVTYALARRDLPAATEALGLVTLGLVAGDVWGARDAGWLTPTNGAQTALVLGTALVVVGTVSAMALSRTAVGRFVSGEVVAAVGAALLAGGVAASAWGTLAGRLVVAVPLVAILAVVSRLLSQVLPEGLTGDAFLPTPEEDSHEAPGTRTPRRRPRPLQVETAGIALVTVVTWMALAVAALDRVLDDLTLGAVWGAGGLPLLAAGVYAALPALLPGPRTARVVAVSVAVVPLTVLVMAPSFDEGATTLALVCAVVTLVVATVLAVGPLPWVRAAASALLVTLPPLLLSGLGLLAAGLTAYAEAASKAWTGSPGGRLDPELADLAAPWVLPLALLVLVVTGFALHRAIGEEWPQRHRVVRVVETAAIVAAHGALLVLPTPVVLLLVLMLLTTLRVGVDALRGHPRMSLEAAGAVVAGLGVAALALAAYDEWLTILACVVLAGLAALYHRRPGTVGAAGGAALGPLGALALWAVAALAEVEGTWAALVVLLALGAWVVLRGLTEPDEDEPHRAAAWAQPVVGAEVGTVVAAGTTALIGVDGFAPAGQESTWVAVYLTVLGVIATIVSLTRPDRRREGGWAGGVLLAAASWVRLADIGVEAPEPYTLPSAVALLTVGWFHLRRHREAGTMRAWSAGLGLALVPSLLWVLSEPVSLRALVLGVVCLGLVLLGVERRWAAPFVWGSAVGTVLALRMLTPVALQVGPFLVFAVGGALLLVVGATWEHRLKDAERLRSYVDGLR